MIISDFRSRTVNIFLLLIFGTLQFTATGLESGWENLLRCAASNIGILLFMAVGIIFYYRCKEGYWINPVNSCVGSGDLLFLFCFTPVFEPQPFLYFLIVSFLFSLCGWGIWMGLKKKKPTIPLVSTVGIVYIIYVFSEKL